MLKSFVNKEVNTLADCINILLVMPSGLAALPQALQLTVKETSSCMISAINRSSAGPSWINPASCIESVGLYKLDANLCHSFIEIKFTGLESADKINDQKLLELIFAARHNFSFALSM